MSATKSDIVASSFSLNPNDPIERLNNFDLRLQALSQDLNEIRIDRLDNLKGTSQKKLRLMLLNLMVEWILMFSLIG